MDIEEPNADASLVVRARAHTHALLISASFVSMGGELARASGPGGI